VTVGSGKASEVGDGFKVPDDDLVRHSHCFLFVQQNWIIGA
jgi:hypothetical protein